MKLIDALEFVAAQRPAWKKGNSWQPPFCYNKEHILRLLGRDKDVAKITKADLAQMRHELMNEAPENAKGKRSAGGVNRIMSMLNTLLKDLQEQEIIIKAPRLKPLRENNARTGYFRREQVERMAQLAIEIYDDELLSTAILFGAFTGCRMSEMLNLMVGDVDLYTDRVTFRDTKNGTDHTLDIHPALRSLVGPLVKGKDPEARVFPFNSADGLRYRFYKLRDLLGLPGDLVWHSLRHSTGTWMAEKGIPITTIASVLNHKNIQTTQRYTKTTDLARRAAINAL